MSIEADAQKDLALNDEDAENVVGGAKKKAKAKHVTHKPAAHAGANINIQAPTTPTEYAPTAEDCDPDGNPISSGDETASVT